MEPELQVLSWDLIHRSFITTQSVQGNVQPGAHPRNHRVLGRRQRLHLPSQGRGNTQQWQLCDTKLHDYMLGSWIKQRKSAPTWGKRHKLELELITLEVWGHSPTLIDFVLGTIFYYILHENFWPQKIPVSRKGGERCRFSNTPFSRMICIYIAEREFRTGEHLKILQQPIHVNYQSILSEIEKVKNTIKLHQNVNCCLHHTEVSGLEFRLYSIVKYFTAITLIFPS